MIVMMKKDIDVHGFNRQLTAKTWAGQLYANTIGNSNRLFLQTVPSTVEYEWVLIGGCQCIN